MSIPNSLSLLFCVHILVTLTHYTLTSSCSEISKTIINTGYFPILHRILCILKLLSWVTRPVTAWPFLTHSQVFFPLHSWCSSHIKLSALSPTPALPLPSSYPCTWCFPLSCLLPSIWRPPGSPQQEVQVSPPSHSDFIAYCYLLLQHLSRSTVNT